MLCRQVPGTKQVGPSCSSSNTTHRQWPTDHCKSGWQVTTLLLSFLLNTFHIGLCLEATSLTPLLKSTGTVVTYVPSAYRPLPHPLYLTSSDQSVAIDTGEHENEDQFSSGLCHRDGIGPLGMESGQIPDSALSASSSFDMLHVGPHNARLKTDNAGGAWCPSKQLGFETSGSEWIQVNLSHPRVVTGVATQGRFGKNMGQEFTEWYYILYSREEVPSKWIKWKSWDGRSNLEGNIDTNTVEEHHLEWPIVGARHIRLVPLSNHTRTVCLRFELYGCLYQGPISYTLPLPLKSFVKQVDSQLLDNSYDGSFSKSNILFGGLGKLTDGVKPSSTTENDDDQSRANIWVGWPRINESTSSSVELTFEFDQVYNFTTTSINCLNNYSRHIRVFSQATVWFSLNGQHWSEPPIQFEYQLDNVIEKARDVIIHLQYRIGRFIRIELAFHSDWLQLSEVSFDCQPLSGNWSQAQVANLFEWLNSNQYKQAADEAGGGGTRYIMPEENAAYNQSGKGSKTVSQVRLNVNSTWIAICLCLLGVVIILLLASLVMKKLNHRKSNVFREISETDLESESATITLKDLTKEDIHLYCDPKEVHEEAEYAIPEVICPSNISKTLSLHKAVPNAIASKTLQINPRFYASSDIICPKQNIYGTRPGSQILNVFDIANLRTLNPGQQYHQMQKLNQQQQAPLLDTFGGLKQTKGGLVHPGRGSLYGDPISATFGVRLYSEAEIGVLQTLGKSKFGDTLLCNIPAAGKNRLSVVRTVNELAFRNEFVHSVQYTHQLSLHCDKFARLFGVIETPSYFASITEHADCDLNYFLRKSSPDNLSTETLLYVANEIANAGAYLESNNQCHRDIATRNVIVYEKSLTIKLTDTAIFMDKYSADYCNGLPIRWMSPESIVRAEVTLQSDIFAFGVCFWEILNFAKCRPFSELSDEDYLTAVYTHFEEQNDMIRLGRPSQCSMEIYELLEECWSLDPTQRPTFKEICLFLQRKLLGFSKPLTGRIH